MYNTQENAVRDWWSGRVLDTFHPHDKHEKVEHYMNLGWDVHLMENGDIWLTFNLS